MQAMRRDPYAGVNDFPDRLDELRRYLGDATPGQRVRAIPGQGTHVPIWLLGSSGYSAQLAARLGCRSPSPASSPPATCAKPCTSIARVSNPACSTPLTP